MTEIIYDAKTQLVNSLSQLYRLKDEGLRVDGACEEMWQEIIDLIEFEDEQKLDGCRAKLKELCEKGK